MLPDAAITIVDSNANSIVAAQRFLDASGAIEHRTFDGTPENTDVVVIPLSYRGDRRKLYLNPPAPFVLIHDWIWTSRGRSVIVSWRLLKRLNLIQRGEP
jgi:hypothetical protein